MISTVRILVNFAFFFALGTPRTLALAAVGSGGGGAGRQGAGRTLLVLLFKEQEKLRNSWFCSVSMNLFGLGGAPSAAALGLLRREVRARIVCPGVLRDGALLRIWGLCSYVDLGCGLLSVGFLLGI